MNNALRLAIATSLVLVAVAGCTKKVKEAPAGDSGNGDTSGASTGGISDSTPGRYSPSDLDTDSCLRQRVVYFDFDDDTLKPEFQATINCHAKYLRDRPESRMNLEGHADERGTREYNLGLGERRGNAVGAVIGNASQVSVISYGEERPTCADSTDDCWQHNRRVEIVYTVK
ncbi:MAG: OmpA family protein [Arenimonas sp.]